jgi:hypothetical protein
VSGIMKRLRDETERAKFEAARALRLQREQGKLGQLENQKSDQLRTLGEVVWEMFSAGQPLDPRLATVCRQVQTVNQQIADQQALIDTIKQEQPPEPPKCARCGRELNGTDAFCPGCGAPVTPAVEARPVSNAVPDAACPNCGNPVRAGATFCARCGQRLI